ncbi:nitrite/sulfite reductase [Microbacterium sp. KUDC0406]|uniref:nitrite/sulfite reductase n=1 Tax=Microbacterium sp. KUDC0406 TaxID=2909588 RepID=UPI001F3D991F|nr:nitrite/sulfite reductase [Microbacterium sp. KUDC0406]UJP09693.1 nitrite/sulfite reductase [Microbacterium sp. KUDC0406]
MTVEQQAPVRGARTRTSRTPSKPHGQWAVDGTEPLNANEEFKLADGGLNVRERIEQVYAKGGFASIDPTDLHGRFRWWGLYTQRKPGIDGGRTAQLEPHELEDEYFMMRVRIDGGQLSTEQLRVIGGISTEFGRDIADITDRQNVQLHWVRIEDVPEIWRRLESVGLQTTEACGDVPRTFLGSAVAGIAEDELIDPTPQLREIVDRYIGDPSYANLPRKYKTAITGHPSLDVVHEINDCSFVAVEHPELGIGYDLWVGGALAAVPRLGERLGAFVAPDRVAEVWEGVTGIFRDYGYRRLRNKARMKFLLADWGVERMREVLETEYLSSPLPDGPAPAEPVGSPDHVGVHRQKDGRFYIGASTTVGRLSGTTLSRLAGLAEVNGSRRVRPTVFQKILVLDVPEQNVRSVQAGLDELGLPSRPSLFRRGTMACTGIEFCKLAIVETKVNAAQAIEQLEERLGALEPEIGRPITLHVNGCPNSCARIQTADIGLKGQLVTIDGEQVPGYQVHLGGGLATEGRPEAGLGRTVRGLKVAADGIADYAERVIRRYLADREAGETFAGWAHRADEEALQ